MRIDSGRSRRFSNLHPKPPKRRMPSTACVVKSSSGSLPDCSYGWHPEDPTPPRHRSLWMAYCLLSTEIPSLDGEPCGPEFRARARATGVPSPAAEPASGGARQDRNQNIENNPMQSKRGPGSPRSCCAGFRAELHATASAEIKDPAVRH